MLKFLNTACLRSTLHFIRLSSSSCIEMSSTTELPIIKKPKYDGRSKKRRWEERRSDKGAAIFPEKKICDETFVRIKRRKYAMLLGYSGVDYYGMQRNPCTRTIEEDLFNALLKANLITQDAFDQIQTIQYQRAARTDKGVSAARQVVSIKLPDEVDISKANEHLPETIRIFEVKRVTKGFNSKSQCDSRTYTYMLPTVAFSLDPQVSQETFRLGEDKLAEINSVLSNYQGTKNFHNFTCKKKYNDPSAKRFIVSFDCESPLIRKDVEFVVLKVKGQSFMLHQIRKMVGLTIAIIKGYTSVETMTKAWTQEKVNIPKAPGLGLVLEQVHYDRYNFRYGNDGIHETLEWNEVNDLVDEFKEKYIYPTIIDTEINDKSLLQWIDSKLYGHRFDLQESEAVGSDEEQSDDEDKDDDDCERDVDKSTLTVNNVDSNQIENNSAQTLCVKQEQQ